MRASQLRWLLPCVPLLAVLCCRTALAAGGSPARVTVVVAAPGSTAAQLFGHVLLCFDLRDDQPEAGSCFDYGRVLEQPSMLGIPTTGGRFGSTREAAFRTLTRYRNQGRELTRFEISASSEEVSRLHGAAVAQLSASSDYVYSRCQRNCATAVFHILQAELGDSWAARVVQTSRPPPFREALVANWDDEPMTALPIPVWDLALIRVSDSCGVSGWMLPAQLKVAATKSGTPTRWVLFFRIAFASLAATLLLRMKHRALGLSLAFLGTAIWLFSLFGPPVGIGTSAAMLAFLPTDFLLIRRRAVSKFYAMARVLGLVILLGCCALDPDPVGHFLVLLPLVAALLRYLVSTTPTAAT